jgi:hypothetical protein
MLDEFEGLKATVLLDEVELDVLIAVDMDTCAALSNKFVDELAKFQPLIWTPWITLPVSVTVIVIGAQDPSPELMGVMTWPFVRVEKHSFASGAGKMEF